MSRALAAAVVALVATLASSCGGPVLCGQVSYASCEDVADARERTTDPTEAGALDECLAEHCTPASE